MLCSDCNKNNAEIFINKIENGKYTKSTNDNIIRFRDYLNDNENMALQYQKVKEELESKYADNRGLYTKGKKEIIDIILNN